VAAAGPYRAQSYGTEEQLIGFGIDYHRFRTIPASVFATRQRLDTRFYQDTVTGKIVFLGGTYRAGRDWYATPLGYEPGVEVLAHTAQTELSAPIRKLDGISSFLEDVVMSLIVLGLVFWMGAATQLIGSAVLSLSFAWLLSRFAYHSPGVFLPVCSVFGGVMVAGLVEFGMTYYELSRDHNRLLHTHRGLTNELTRLKRRLSAHALAVDSGPESDR
jgi:CHASE2 domain-containing sensor protein